MNGRALTTLLASLLVLFPVSGEGGATETILPGGLRLVVEERPSTETAAVRLIIGGGTLGDTGKSLFPMPSPGKRSKESTNRDAQMEQGSSRRGLAELHARLLLRGTKTRSGAALAREAEDMGGRLSAYAGLRSETISLDLPAESCERAIPLVADILLHPRFDPADLEKEKDLLLGSLASSRDDPTNDLEDEVLRLLFPKHPLLRLVRLQDAEVRAVSIGDVRAFHGTRLAAFRGALLIVGRCDRGKVEAAAAEAFRELDDAAPSRRLDNAGEPAVEVSPGGSAGTSARATWEDSSGTRPSGIGRSRATPGQDAPHLAGDALPPPAPLPGEVRKRVRKRTTQAEIMVALPTQGVSDEDAPAYSVMRFLLGGFQERLSREIREKRGYAYWLAAEGLALPTAGWFGIHTGARKEHLAEIERIVRSELGRIVDEPASTEELERARRYLTTSEARLDASNGGRASILAGALIDGRPLRTYDQRVARLAAVTPEQVQRLARRLFEGQALAVVTLH